MFYDSNFLGVIVLGAGFGVALNQLAKKSEYLLGSAHCYCNQDLLTKLIFHLSLVPSDVNWDRILTIQVLEELMEGKHKLLSEIDIEPILLLL